MSEHVLPAHRTERVAFMERLAHTIVPPRPRVRWNGDGPLLLSGKSLKVTVVVDPSQLSDIVVPQQASRTPFMIDVAGQTIVGEFNSRSVRRAIAAVAEHGADAVVAMATGRLVGNRIEDAGMSVLLKTRPADTDN